MTSGAFWAIALIWRIFKILSFSYKKYFVNSFQSCILRYGKSVNENYVLEFLDWNYPGGLKKDIRWLKSTTFWIVIFNPWNIPIENKSQPWSSISHFRTLHRFGRPWFRRLLRRLVPLYSHLSTCRWLPSTKLTFPWPFSATTAPSLRVFCLPWLEMQLFPLLHPQTHTACRVIFNSPSRIPQKNPREDNWRVHLSVSTILHWQNCLLNLSTLCDENCRTNKILYYLYNCCWKMSSKLLNNLWFFAKYYWVEYSNKITFRCSYWNTFVIKFQN